MELKEIGEALGIDNRVMRYLMEQEIVPGIAKVNKGRGTRRDMSTAQARLVGLAAMLHELEFRGPVVQIILKKAKPKLAKKEKVIEIGHYLDPMGLGVSFKLYVSQLYEKIK